jgi:hypothetical protein
MTQIGKGMFRGCTALESIVIPASVTEIAPDAFCGCARLTKIDYSGPACRFEGGAMLSADGTKLLGWMGWGPEYAKSADVPDSVTEVGPGAFRDLPELETVRLPDGLKKISENAFRGCRTLKTIPIPGGVREIGEQAFEYCRALKSVVIPAGVAEIGKEAFDGCDALESVVISPGVEAISARAFA